MTEEVKKKKPWGRKWKITLYITVGIAIILLIAYPLLNKTIENMVKENLKQVAPFAIVRFSSIHVNLFYSRISINDLSIIFQPDTSDTRHHHLFNFSKADLTGISFFNALLNKHLSVNKLKLYKGAIELDQFLLNKKDSLQYAPLSRMPFKNISIKQFETSETNVWTHLDQEKKLLLQGIININDLQIINPRQSPSAKTTSFNAIQCHITNIDYPIPSTHQALQIKQLSLDSRKGFLGIDSLDLISSAIDNSSAHIDAFISGITISKFDILKLADRKLIAGTIIINKSNSNIWNHGSTQNKPESPQMPGSDLKQIFNEIRIDSLIIAHSSCNMETSFKNWKTNKNSLNSIDLNFFSINHLLVTEAAFKLHSNNIDQFKIRKMEIAGLNRSPDSSLGWSSFKCNISDISYRIPRVYRTLHINSLEADSKKMLLKIADAKITTQYSKIEYGKKLGRQADYIDATVPLIEISEIDFKQLVQQRLVAGKIMINESKFYFFRDRRLPRQLKEQPMPNDYLKQLPIELRVNTFKLDNASVVYEEYPKIGKQTGYLAIGKMNISMSPILNHPGKNDPGYSITYVEGSIMNAGLIKATIRAPLRKNIYYVKGDIKDLDLPKLNPSAENLGRFHIESGILNFLEFHFTATEETATGEIIGEYHDLIIDRLKEKKGEKRVAKVPTFLLKHLIIPKNKDKSLNVKKRTGKIEYKRDNTRLASFYLLKTLLDGIRASFTLGFLLPK